MNNKTNIERIIRNMTNNDIPICMAEELKEIMEEKIRY